MKTLLTRSFLLLMISGIFVGCNKSDGYKEISNAAALESDVASPDLERKIICAEAMNMEACISLKDECSIVFSESEDVNGERSFVACVANPNEPEIQDPATEESVEEYVDKADNCKNLNPKYLLPRNGQPKVMICHASKNTSHTISVACPALKAHVAHQYGKDYLGVCKE